MKIEKFNNQRNFIGYYNYPSLKSEVSNIGDLTKVRELYGQIGVDILETNGKYVTLVKNKSSKPQSLLNKIITFLRLSTETKKNIYKYNEDDTLSDVMQKYMCNETSGTYDDILKMFGKRGIEQMETFKAMGYTITNT